MPIQLYHLDDIEGVMGRLLLSQHCKFDFMCRISSQPSAEPSDVPHLFLWTRE
jgi:hypothetical protein